MSWSYGAPRERVLSFEVERAEGSQGPFRPVGSAGSDAALFTDPEAPAGKTLFCRVRARGDGGISAWSALAQVTTRPPALPPPVGLRGAFDVGNRPLAHAIGVPAWSERRPGTVVERVQDGFLLKASTPRYGGIVSHAARHPAAGLSGCPKAKVSVRPGSGAVRIIHLSNRKLPSWPMPLGSSCCTVVVRWQRQNEAQVRTAVPDLPDLRPVQAHDASWLAVAAVLRQPQVRHQLIVARLANQGWTPLMRWSEVLLRLILAAR